MAQTLRTDWWGAGPDLDPLEEAVWGAGTHRASDKSPGSTSTSLGRTPEAPSWPRSAQPGWPPMPPSSLVFTQQEEDLG